MTLLNISDTPKGVFVLCSIHTGINKTLIYGKVHKQKTDMLTNHSINFRETLVKWFSNTSLVKFG